MAHVLKRGWNLRMQEAAKVSCQLRSSAINTYSGILQGDINTQRHRPGTSGASPRVLGDQGNTTVPYGQTGSDQSETQG